MAKKKNGKRGAKSESFSPQELIGVFGNNAVLVLSQKFYKKKLDNNTWVLTVAIYRSSKKESNKPMTLVVNFSQHIYFLIPRDIDLKTEDLTRYRIHSGNSADNSKDAALEIATRLILKGADGSVTIPFHFQEDVPDTILRYAHVVSQENVQAGEKFLNGRISELNDLGKDTGWGLLMDEGGKERSFNLDVVFGYKGYNHKEIGMIEGAKVIFQLSDSGRVVMVRVGSQFHTEKKSFWKSIFS